MIIWYDCPSCGAEKSSDGEHFCGKCEERYQREQRERDAEDESARRRMKMEAWDDEACP